MRKPNRNHAARVVELFREMTAAQAAMQAATDRQMRLRTKFQRDHAALEKALHEAANAYSNAHSELIQLTKGKAN